jgi:flagellar motor switch protein FliG
VLRQLGPREVQKLTMKMSTMTPQARDAVEPVLIELNEQFGRGAMIQSDDDQLREMLTKALGDERAGHLLSRILSGSDTAGIESLKWMDAATIADLIKNEHPQIIATILVHLEYDQAGEILKTVRPSACATTWCCASPPSTACSRWR